MSEETIKEALATYHPTDASIAKMREEYMLLRVDGLDDKAGFKAVREARMLVRSKRTDVEKTRKALKADALEHGRRVDAEAKRITAQLVPIEEHLQEQERVIEDERKRIEAEEAERKTRKFDARMEQLSAVGYQKPSFYVESLSDEAFASELEKATEEHAERQVIAAKADEERRKEEERIAKESAALEEARAKQQAEEEAVRAKLEAERAELEVERQRLAKEEAARQIEADLERARQEAKLEAEARIERERVESETKAKVEAEEVAHLEALRPDVERVSAYLVEVQAIAIPECKWSGSISMALRNFANTVEGFKEGAF